MGIFSLDTSNKTKQNNNNKASNNGIHIKMCVISISWKMIDGSSFSMSGAEENHKHWNTIDKNRKSLNRIVESHTYTKNMQVKSKHKNIKSTSNIWNEIEWNEKVLLNNNYFTVFDVDVHTHTHS